jgi:hypothetical protein
MALFNFGSDQEHRVFNYRPIYYDEEKEARRKKFGAVDGSLEKDAEEGKYVPGSYVRGAFKDGNYQRLRKASKVSTIIGLIGALLVCAILYYIAKFYSLL